MRTTFTLDDDAAALAQNYAKARSLRLGKAVSELIRRASAPPMTLKRKKLSFADLHFQTRKQLPQQLTEVHRPPQQ